MKNGTVLELIDSPVKIAQNIAETLENGNEQAKLEALRQLSEIADDSKYAVHFANKNGFPILIEMIRDALAFANLSTTTRRPG